ncbi:MULTISPECIES: cold shock domain-containing protein [unclassified Ensifer]|uniref:cold-shock protein n=2 Tax=Ensifer TaxID=106591 RepID=UPI00114667E9|nr:MULTISPECIES: cold shock domain-containing protein [unclassified Ensifer]
MQLKLTVFHRHWPAWLFAASEAFDPPSLPFSSVEVCAPRTLGIPPTPCADMITGTIMRFDFNRGYGFVQPEDGSRAVYVDARALYRSGIKSIFPGQTFRFEIWKDEKGRIAARNLRL